MSVSRFKTIAQVEAGRPVPATVTIDRDANIFAVRPHKRHRVYELPLSTVAEMVTWRVIQAELRIAKKEKKAKRAAR